MNVKLKRRLEALEETSFTLLKRIQAGTAQPKSRLPAILSAYVGTPDLSVSTCTRTLHTNGALCELIKSKTKTGG